MCVATFSKSVRIQIYEASYTSKSTPKRVNAKKFSKINEKIFGFSFMPQDDDSWKTSDFDLFMAIWKKKDAKNKNYDLRHIEIVKN